MARFQAAVERDGSRTAWNCMTVALWQNGLTPEVRTLQRGYTPVKSLKEAIDRARRLEESEPVITVSATHSVSSTTTRAAAVFQARPKQRVTFKQSPTLRPPTQQRGTPAARGRGSGRGGGQRRPSFDPCTHPSCRSHKTHPIERCWVRIAEEEERQGRSASKRSRKDRRRKQKDDSSDSE
ncbi:unnamed protein product [Ectocarpus sp. CCAP 1310/34]|nr:unnamed protein product [Ectocarpus sp. CCAP 1310/34]